MGHVNIESLLRLVAEYRKPDPRAVRQLLERILEILKNNRNDSIRVCSERKKERLDECK